MSLTQRETGESLLDLAHQEDLDHEILERVTVAFESNPNQSLILLETEHASGAIAIDVSELTLAEVLEEIGPIAEHLDRLAHQPVFATDGGESA